MKGGVNYDKKPEDEPDRDEFERCSIDCPGACFDFGNVWSDIIGWDLIGVKGMKN